MGDYYQYDRDRGLIVPDTSTLKADVQAEYKTALGTNLDLTDSTPQGRLIDAETNARSSILGYTSGVANQINPDLSGGVFLASIFSLMGGNPYVATPTVISDVRVYGTQDTISPSGLQIYDGSGNYFVQQTAVMIDQVDTTVTPNTFYGAASFRAVIAGPTAAAAMTRWLIASPVPANITTVVNPVAGVTGKVAETDAEARNRRKNTLAKQARNSVRGSRALVSDLSGFRSMTIRENDLSVPQTIDGIAMPKNSIYVCVQGAVDGEIAEALLEAKSTGTAWTTGTVTRGTQVSTTLVEPASGQDYTVLFARPTIVPCTCEVFYDTSQSVGNSEPQFAIQDAITRYQNGEINGDPGLTIGRNLSAYELSGAISTVYPGIYVSSILVTGKSVVDGQEIQIEAWEQANFAIGSIVVTPRV
jgi:hypothetical protein